MGLEGDVQRRRAQWNAKGAEYDELNEVCTEIETEASLRKM